MVLIRRVDRKGDILRSRHMKPKPSLGCWQERLLEAQSFLGFLSFDHFIVVVSQVI